MKSRFAMLAVACALVVAGIGWASTQGTAEEPPGHSAGDGAPTFVTPSTVAPSTTIRGHADVAQPAPSQVQPRRPRSITLASGTTMRVRVVSTGANGDLEIPTNINEAGWWDGGSRLGDPFGAIVIAAHVDSFTQGIGRFAELLSMHRGEVVTVRSGGLTRSFTVVSAELVDKSAVNATSREFAADGAPRLVLITCGGTYDPDAGGYQSNMVVVAEPSPDNG